MEKKRAAGRESEGEEGNRGEEAEQDCSPGLEQCLLWLCLESWKPDYLDNPISSLLQVKLESLSASFSRRAKPLCVP